MARLAVELGVEIHLDAPVRRSDQGGPPPGCGSRTIGRARADVVVANAEWAYTQRELLRRGERTRHLTWLLGVLFLVAAAAPGGRAPHTFILSGDFEGNLADIFDRRCLPENPSIYLSRPTATDRRWPPRAPSSCTCSCRPDA